MKKIVLENIEYEVIENINDCFDEGEVKEKSKRYLKI